MALLSFRNWLDYEKWTKNMAAFRLCIVRAACTNQATAIEMNGNANSSSFSIIGFTSVLDVTGHIMWQLDHVWREHCINQSETGTKTINFIIKQL